MEKKNFRNWWNLAKMRHFFLLREINWLVQLTNNLLRNLLEII